jgi:hypothetical protein
MADILCSADFFLDSTYQFSEDIITAPDTFSGFVTHREV